MARKGFVISLLLALGVLTMTSYSANVTYDHRALVIDGKRRLLISGSIHYPRSTPDMWPGLIQKSKDGGLDVIETYVFWNLHEPVRGRYDFEGRKDLVQFVKTVAQAGLYVHLRIGPYVSAEWNYGGFPLWLHLIRGIEFRTDNEPFKAEMKRFTAKIVDLMKQEKLYASQGGPIILSQIENEYGNLNSADSYSGKSYTKWSAGMAVSLDTGVPWVMCQQPDAPDPIINTCNGLYCDSFTPNYKNKPKMWTANWSGWFLYFGRSVPFRPVEDLVFSAALFFQRGGTFQNYYMYHGGTNFGRTAGGPFVATSYDYDAPIDEYGHIRHQKWGHLKDLHTVIKLIEEALLATDPTITSLNSDLEARVYGKESCAAFLSNTGSSDANVQFSGNSYNLPAWSVSILPDCKNVGFNTAKINSLASSASFTHQSLIDNGDSLGSVWSWINESVGISKVDAFSRLGLLEQINTTADKSDYLWYSFSIGIKGDEPFLDQTVLQVESLGHAFHAFINGKPVASAIGNSDNANVSAEIPVALVRGKYTIDLLSLTVGLQNSGEFYDKKGAGIIGPVKLIAKNGSFLDLSKKKWTYQIGLKGEELNLSSGRSSQWISQSTLPKKQPLIWYKTNFDAPAGSDPIALDLLGLGKGEAWVNGQSIGRYWPAYSALDQGCSYIGSYDSGKCHKNSGEPSQQLYHVPRAWLKPSGNTLVLFEEMGGDPTQISFATRQMQSFCAQVSETHPPPVDMWISNSIPAWGLEGMGPTLSLNCPFPKQVISSVKFASFGTPSGSCGSFRHGSCSSTGALSIVRKACIGLNRCKSISVSIDTFGDPCYGQEKNLAVEVSCT